MVRRVFPYRGVADVGALGAAMCAAVAANLQIDLPAAVARMAPAIRTVEPSRDKAELYRAELAQYRHLRQLLSQAYL